MMLAQLVTPFADLTRDDRILTVLALGAATIAILHFGIFEAPRLWREFLAALERFRKALDRAPARPQWTEEVLEPVRRQQLDVVVEFPPRRIR